MQLSNNFTVERRPAETWEALKDLEQTTLCMPGATLTSVDGDAFTGKVTLRVGPVMMTYTGEGVIEDRDDAARVLTMRLRGKEAKGAGTAAALVRATLSDEGADSTRVEVTTDLDLTGKPAQFGRGVLTEVAGVIISEFARNLAHRLQSGPEPAPPPGPASVSDAGGLAHGSPPPTPMDQPVDDALDLGSLALTMAKEHKSGVLAVGSAMLAVLAFLLGRSSGKRAG